MKQTKHKSKLENSKTEQFWRCGGKNQIELVK